MLIKIIKKKFKMPISVHEQGTKILLTFTTLIGKLKIQKFKIENFLIRKNVIEQKNERTVNVLI